MNPPKDAPAFDFYPERWIAGTRHMTKTERSDYLELLCIQWLEDGLPDDLDRMARIVGHKHAGQLSPQVMEKFPLSEDGTKRRNRRLEKERAEQRERIATAREKSQKMHAARYEKQRMAAAASTAASSPPAVPEGCPPPTTHHPPLSEAPTPRAGAPEGEPSSGFPETEAQARSLAEMADVPPDYAATLWLECEGRGGKDMRGNLIPYFASFMKACWNRKQEADLAKRPPGKAAHGAAKSTTPSIKTDNWGQAPIPSKNL